MVLFIKASVAFTGLRGFHVFAVYLDVIDLGIEIRGRDLTYGIQ
jgi:hypothetical protein